jgi:Tfp pilus assembly protein PilF
MMQSNDYTSAETEVNAAIAINDSFADSYYLRGLARSKIRRLIEAMQDFIAAVRLKPDHRGAIENLRRVKDHLDRAGKRA